MHGRAQTYEDSRRIAPLALLPESIAAPLIPPKGLTKVVGYNIADPEPVDVRVLCMCLAL
jgi:hypothetical protein